MQLLRPPCGVGLLDQLDLARTPALVEERLERAVQAQDRHTSPLSGIVWIQLPRVTPSGCVGPKYTVVEPSAFGFGGGRRIALAAGARIALRRVEHRASLVVIHGERPEPRRRNVRAEASPCRSCCRRRALPSASSKVSRYCEPTFSSRMHIAGVIPVAE